MVKILIALSVLVRPAPLKLALPIKSCLKSSTCATEQILFCQNASHPRSSNIADTQKQNIVRHRYAYEYYRPDHRLRQTHECVIMAALNPHCFTIQFKEDALEFDQFQRDMNTFYNDIDDDEAEEYLVRPEQIRMNLCVICADPKSSDSDPIWNRSQILDYDPVDETVNLFYVDLGTWDEYVPIHRLRHLIEEFHSHLVFSLTCRLAHISPASGESTWSQDATEQFLAVIDQALPEIELLACEQDRCYQTNIFVSCSGQYICVNDYLIHIKKAKASLQPISTDKRVQTLVRYFSEV